MKTLRILHLEDDPDDAEVIRLTLKAEGIACSVVRVETKDDFIAALKQGGFDLIFADHSLPQFDGLSALAIAQEKFPDIPFIFVTGTLGEDLAIETLKSGATDYVLKHRMQRLGPSVLRALREATERSERKRAEEKLRETNEQLRALAARLQSVREEERIWIAREIHDELGQALTALKIDLSWLESKLPRDQKPLLNKTKSISKLVDNTIRSLRRIASELRPGVLDNLGLAAAIEWQAQEFQTRTGITCRCWLNLDDSGLSKEQSTAIFRIFQEALTNVARHANATDVDISLEEKAGELVLEVRDNGKGITESEISNPKSLGLLGMRERAFLLGGEVKIIGAAGKGTAVTVYIPLKRMEQAEG